MVVSNSVKYCSEHLLSIINTDSSRPKRAIIFGVVVAAVLAALIIVGIIFLLPSDDSKEKLGAIVTNGQECADIGKSIINKGGKAVDAAIASLFCEGVAMAQSCGLGGGFLMTLFDKKSGKVYILNSRETAPKAATVDMFNGSSDLSSRGILSVAVPAELRGYWRAYNRFGGGVPWKDLVQPTIDLCRNGLPVTEYLEGIYAGKRDLLYADENLRQSYIDPATNNTYKKGQLIRRLKLADTLEIIAKEGGDALHNGSLTDQFIADIKSLNGIITKEDIQGYEPIWEEPIKMNLPFGQTLYTVPLPGSGAILAYMLNMLQLILDISQPKSLTNLQRIVESFKFAYGMRTRLGDTNTTAMNKFVKDLASMEKAKLTVKLIKDNKTSQDPEYYGAQIAKIGDHGTAHISVLAPDGDAVSVTSTVNLYFGSGVSAKHSDIILNDQMDDFSSPDIVSQFDIPPSKDNFIKPGKRPLSSMCPVIILDKNNEVRLVIGAAGGTKITTAIALVIINHLWYNMTIKESIDSCRLHHQLFPMQIQAEECYANDDFENFMTKIGHKQVYNSSDGFSAVTSVTNDGGIWASYDKRRPGDTSYIY
ncbi:hypothetical protein HHI36_014851 [Cryptolaemus montrouzieri]|uniref:Uncharacterized protein n=1 Tax=Cryptolaemus montrouzieri TaxID=559131 RepID=A0ABD2N3U6_9CUCU